MLAEGVIIYVCLNMNMTCVGPKIVKITCKTHLAILYIRHKSYLVRRDCKNLKLFYEDNTVQT